MKIERIDDKTVKCFLSNEELEAYEITYKDFIVRSAKAKEVVEEIIIHAEEEVGFQPPRIAFDLQIMMLPDQGMLLTFTEKGAEEGEPLKGILSGIDDMGEVKGDNILAGQLTGQTMEMEQPAVKPDTGREGQDKETEKETVHKNTPKQAVFAFECLSDLCNYVGILPGILRVKSAFYKWGDTYYIHIERAAASRDRYGRICIRALEFGRLYTAEPKRIHYLQEQAKCILEEKALNKLRQLRNG